MENSDLHDIENDIAIIGLSCRFPGARSVDEFWQNIAGGKESIRFFTDDELEKSGIPASVYNQPNYVKANSILEDIDLFDASFFGYTPRQAELMDPQQRLFLESAWEALESSGYVPDRYAGRIGVFAGESWETYLLNNLYQNHALINDVGLAQVLQGNKPSNLTTRTSYKLNLRGPSMTINTACSTSLVAVVMGCQSLLNYQCDIALTGGVCIRIPQNRGYQYENGGMVSPDGHCRTFDASAEGTVFGNGVGLVALKRLEDALQDNDTVHAVIKGHAINNDGSMKAGFTAPSVEGQSEVIVEAIASAEIDPATITLIEAHGTGTYLGDPIEIEALTQAFRSATQAKRFCAIGSVKTNIGHMDSAAGIAGLIKAVMALKHKKLPPSLHYKQANPRIDFDNTPFYVNTELQDWEKSEFPRRAGVSSLGVGGTNAHVVLEEAPEARASGASRPWQIVVLSAKSASGLDLAAENFVAHLKRHDELNFADAAFTLSAGRTAFDHRRIAVCKDASEAIALLSSSDSPGVFTSSHEVKARSAVFMFPGQGAQHVNMGLNLYQSEPGFRKHVDYCAEFLEPLLGFDLRAVLYPEEANENEAEERLKQTSVTQPALFVIEYALAELYAEWGIRPQAMIGHSIGEYVAACLAGIFSLDDSLALVAERGRLMQEMAEGTMLAVPLSADELQSHIGGTLSIATVNAPSLCVASGPTEEIHGLEERLKQRGVECQRLNTSHAFHSQMMEPALERFCDAASRVDLNPPRIPVVSNVTGTWLTDEQATDPNYWARHLRHSVLFSQGLQHFTQDADQILLEVGPGTTLSSLAMKHMDRAKDQIILKSMRHPRESQPDTQLLLTTLGKLWLSGVNVDWQGLFGHEKRRRIPLPTYPFERKRYWIDSLKASKGGEPTTENQQKEVSKNPSVSEWFYTPSWKRSPILQLRENSDTSIEKPRMLIFGDAYGLGEEIAEQLEQLGHDIVIVTAGKQLNRFHESAWAINPRDHNDYDSLIGSLKKENKVPAQILYLWGVTQSDDITVTTDILDNFSDVYFYGLIYLAQALGIHTIEYSVDLTIVSNNMQEVTGDEALSPEKSLLKGPCKVIPKEYPNITCRSIDLILPQDDGAANQEFVRQLLSEITSKSTDPIVAYRGKHRWVQTFEPVQLNDSSQHTPKLKAGGVYLITGGLGGIGLVLAEHLAKSVNAKLLLTSRTPLPPRNEWEQWLAAHTQDDEDSVSRKIRKIRGIEQLGAEVRVFCADVCDEKLMRETVESATEEFGRIHGIIHAAGIPDGAVIQGRTRELTDKVLAPKVKGALILDSLFKESQLDFILLCSSLASIIAPAGQVAYTAANSFLDAFAQYKSMNNSTFTVSIDWDGWQEVGMAVEAFTQPFPDDSNFDDKQENPHPRGAVSDRLKHGILPSEGVEVFNRVLEFGLPQVVVSTQDLTSRIQSKTPFKENHTLEAVGKNKVLENTYQRSELSSTYVGPSNEIERTIAEIWQSLIGIEQIGIHDNFFEIGGDSLIFLQVATRLREQYQVEISFKKLFEKTTISKLAEAVMKELTADVDNSDLAQMLTEIGDLSEDELRDALLLEKDR